MELCCSLGGVIDILRPTQGIADLYRSKFTKSVLDFSLFCTPYMLESKTQTNLVHDLELQVQQFLMHCPKEIQWSVARAPFLMRSAKKRSCNVYIEEVTKASIQLCAAAGCHALIVRPLFAGISKEKVWIENRAYYLRLAKVAMQYNVILLLENQCQDLNGRLIRGLCSDPKTAVRWVDELNSEAGERRFGFCLDTGSCTICKQQMGTFVLTLGDRLKVVLLRDSDPEQENSLLPFTWAHKGRCESDWQGLIQGLRQISFDGTLALDIADTAAAFSPILRPQMISIAHSVAEFFRFQIELEYRLKEYPDIVLFGAGNMCRNYMRWYGKQYAPLFTCDNNQALWGTEFCGLQVKPPEALQNIPEHCVILICNVYYREIEAQLREMGVRNQIAYFNDEYIPAV